MLNNTVSNSSDMTFIKQSSRAPPVAKILKAVEAIVMLLWCTNYFV